MVDGTICIRRALPDVTHVVDNSLRVQVSSDGARLGSGSIFFKRLRLHPMSHVLYSHSLSCVIFLLDICCLFHLIRLPPKPSDEYVVRLAHIGQ